MLSLFHEWINRCQQLCSLPTPLVLHSTSPCLNNMSVGTDCTPYRFAVTPYLSTSTLIMRILSPSTSFTCSKMGCIILHYAFSVSSASSSPYFGEIPYLLGLGLLSSTQTTKMMISSTKFMINAKMW